MYYEIRLNNKDKLKQQGTCNESETGMKRSHLIEPVFCNYTLDKWNRRNHKTIFYIGLVLKLIIEIRIILNSRVS